MTAPGAETPFVVNCPRCGHRVPSGTRQGSIRCASGHAFEFALFTPAPPSGRSRPAALVESAQTPCARHARNAAVAACERCGTFICALCRVDLDGAPVCLPCFERAQADQGVGQGGLLRRDYNRACFSVAMLSLLVFPLAPLGGPIAIGLGVLGWREDRRSGERLHPVLGVLGVVIGLLAFVAGLLVWGGVFFRRVTRGGPLT